MLAARLISALLSIAALSPQARGQSLGDWRELLSFRPTTEVQRTAQTIGHTATVHRIEDGSGRVNLDYYPITITRLPTIDGQQLSAAELLAIIRKDFNRFTDSSMATFEPFKEADAAQWSSDDPNGAVMLVRINLTPAVADLALVITSASSSDKWRFSTVRGGSGYTAINDRANPGAHPVSGNREFGYTKIADGWIIYTRGADRATRPMDEFWGVPGAREIVFTQAASFWESFQDKIADFVNNHAGSATVDRSRNISSRHDWDEVRNNKDIYNIDDQPAWAPVPEK